MKQVHNTNDQETKSWQKDFQENDMITESESVFKTNTMRENENKNDKNRGKN